MTAAVKLTFLGKIVVILTKKRDRFKMEKNFRFEWNRNRNLVLDDFFILGWIKYWKLSLNLHV